MEAWGKFDRRGMRMLWVCSVARRGGRGRIAGGETGSALVELAVVVALLGVPMLLGVGEMGSLVYDSIEISDAANAGALYGMQGQSAVADTSGMKTAAQSDATDFGTNLGVTSSTYYVCALAVTGTQYTGTNAQTNATAACTGTGNHALQFVQVNTSATITPAIHLFGTSFTLRGTSAMEVEQP